jgi:hypothetical protein
VGERAAAAAFADEVHEVGESTFFGAELCFLEPDGLRDVSVECLDLGGDLLEDLVQPIGRR